MKRRSIKPYQWEVMAKDYNSPFIRNYIWTMSLYKFPKLFKISRAVLGIASQKNTIEYFGDLPSWTEAHNDLKKLIQKDNLYLDKHIDKTNQFGESFNQWSKKNIFTKNLNAVSNDQLVKLLNDFIDKQSTLYAYGVVLPILDFQGYSFVEGNLKQILKNKTKSQVDYEKYFRILTQPIKNSFAQDQEEDLLKLMQKFYSKKWKQGIQNKPLSEIQKLYPAFYKALTTHTKKHAWVYYVYEGPAFTEQSFLNFIKDYLEKNTDPGSKLKKLQAKKTELKKLRAQYIKDLKPNQFEKIILNLAGKIVWAKPRRKDYQSKSYFHLEKLIRELSRRLFISLTQAKATPLELLEKSLKTGKIDLNKVNAIFNFHVCLPQDNGVVKILSGKPAQDFCMKKIKREKLKKFKNLKFLQGSPAQPGLVTGKVKIINLPEDMTKMNQGDILVSTATTPALVPAMKKAGAIITDEGGLTCHAAIVSRELEIPCVVGLKIATKLFKDNDLIEVDANTGIVKRIN